MDYYLAPILGGCGMRALRRVLGRVAETVSEALPVGIIDPWILWWIILSLMLPSLLAGVM